MVANFLLIALRNLFKNKIFSFINVFGLALGIASSLLILEYARYELSYDRFESNSGRIYRLRTDRYNDGKLGTRWAAGAAGLGQVVKEALPEVESFARLRNTGGIMSYKDEQFRETKMYFANENFLPMFSCQAVAGSTGGALKDVFSAVITESTARKYFGTEDPLGKMLSLNKSDNFRVTAVVRDPPPNTHLKFDILLSWATLVQKQGPGVNTQWDWDGFFNYILVRPGTDPAELEKKIAGVVQAKWGEVMKSTHDGMVIHLQALPDIHLTSHYMREAEANGDGRTVYFLLIIAGFIIVIAWINYINLATARSIERAKEVGVRKVLGSPRSQLIKQFLLESMLINGLAVLLAFLIILLCIPFFHLLTGKELHFSLLSDPVFWLILTGLFGIGSFLSGLYPAFVLSSFRPIAVLKGRLAKTSHGALLRQSLVVLQFAASVILIAGTFAVYRQLHFMQHQDLGVRISQTLVLNGPRVLDSTYDNKLTAFKTEALRLPGVKQVTVSTEVPGGLAAFIVNQRTKEIGIRKIVGANLSNILVLLTKDFIRPVLISFVVAVPVAWYVLQKWLDHYAFRITITAWMFIIPGLLVLAIALLTISTQTLRAASANPSKALRTE